MLDRKIIQYQLDCLRDQATALLVLRLLPECCNQDGNLRVEFCPVNSRRCFYLCRGDRLGGRPGDCDQPAE
jgi:hypothetical protein